MKYHVEMPVFLLVHFEHEATSAEDAISIALNKIQEETFFGSVTPKVAIEECGEVDVYWSAKADEVSGES